MAKTERLFTKETDLCAAFIDAVQRGRGGKGWTCYAESGGYDLLLAHEDGRQIGIEAKLRFSAEVLVQATEEWVSTYSASEGPDYRAILIPRNGVPAGMARLANLLGVTVIEVYKTSPWGAQYLFDPQLPDKDAGLIDWQRVLWHEMLPERRLAVPEYVPDVAAGASAPTKLTAWKIAALKLTVLIDQTGYLTRDDFREKRIDHRRWLAADWLKPENGRWVKDNYPPFAEAHPKVYAEILADPKAWRRAVPLMVSKG